MNRTLSPRALDKFCKYGNTGGRYLLEWISSSSDDVAFEEIHYVSGYILLEEFN